MYLSQLSLNPRDRGVRQDLADCHHLHRTLMNAFPQAPAEATGGAREYFGVLYRVESDARSGATRVLVQSRERPDWTRLAAVQPGYLLDVPDGPPPHDCKDFGTHLNRLISEGAVLRFRLRANPTRRVDKNRHPDDKLRAKRVQLFGEEEWQAWLARKGERGGFALLTVQAEPSGDERQRAAGLFGLKPSADRAVPNVRASEGLTITGRKELAPGNRAKLTFGAVLFEGRLRVTDAERFRTTIEHGIGSGKAYGFGLLSIAPAGA
jgi:CRISPR system Cascade subunit CasE